MINLHERMLPTSTGFEPVTSWSPVRCASNCATEAGSFSMKVMWSTDTWGHNLEGLKIIIILYMTCWWWWFFKPLKLWPQVSDVVKLDSNTPRFAARCFIDYVMKHRSICLNPNPEPRKCLKWGFSLGPRASLGIIPTNIVLLPC